MSRLRARVAREATEAISLDAAAARLPETVEWVGKVMERIEPLAPSRRPLRVLDVGAAQGRALVALQRLGCDATGVEPWAEARDVALGLGSLTGVDIAMREGSAEALPFQDESFDVVLAFSVMEHVIDLDRSLSEIRRVLAPGGVFWFYSASAVCPRQSEIRGFPLFGWYPDPLKRRIMLWAKARRPELIGHTSAPALHWWTPARARRKLRAAGFGEVWNRWQLFRPSELHGYRGAALRLVRRSRVLQLLADVAEEGCAYAARRNVQGDS